MWKLFFYVSYQLWQFMDAYQSWQLTILDVSSTCINASLPALSACCPFWKLPEHRNNALLSPWNTPMMVLASSRLKFLQNAKQPCCLVKLQCVANMGEFPSMCKILPASWLEKYTCTWCKIVPPKKKKLKYKGKRQNILVFPKVKFFSSHFYTSITVTLFWCLRCHMDQASRIWWAFQLGR